MYSKSDIKVHALLFSVCISNALNYSISKIVMDGFVDPMSVIFIRIFCTSVFFWIMSMLLQIKETVAVSDYKRLVVCSLLGISCNQLMFYNGLHRTTPINASVMTLMSPIIIFLVTHFVVKEKSAWWQMLGVLLAGVGAALLLFGKGVAFGRDTFVGDMLILGNSTVYAIFVVLVTPLMRKYHPVTVMKLVFTLAMPVVFPLTYSKLGEAHWGQMTLVPWLSLLFIIIFGTIYNYYVNTWSLRHVSPSVNGGYIYSIPFLATIFAIIMDKDVLTVEKLLYGALIFTGVYLVSRKRNTMEF
ncbi:MAG TPA: DMT family transporter [Cytophagales bacterium]|nr:DMT family transporter [Cytophagales bacterium]